MTGRVAGPALRWGVRLGHAIGLPHTDQFPDIMYSFQFGGDIPEYFGRFRRKLMTRVDIAKTSAISPNDRQRLLVALSRY